MPFLFPSCPTQQSQAMRGGRGREQEKPEERKKSGLIQEGKERKREVADVVREWYPLPTFCCFEKERIAWEKPGRTFARRSTDPFSSFPAKSSRSALPTLVPQAACSFLPGPLLNATKGDLFEGLGKMEKEMSRGWVEHPLPRPQRGVLTTRRPRHQMIVGRKKKVQYRNSRI